jgi:1-deoxy-D-xylulose-5-phosphate reductoisomerase
MRLPILYALTYPERLDSELKFDLTSLKKLDFEAPDVDRFPCLRLAYEAVEEGGAKTIALNAADEVAVAAFLDGVIRFDDIPRTIKKVLDETTAQRPESIRKVLQMDAEARALAADVIGVENPPSAERRGVHSASGHSD